jgi:hypothetical protein
MTAACSAPGRAVFLGELDTCCHRCILAIGVLHIEALQELADRGFLREGDRPVGAIAADDAGKAVVDVIPLIEVHVLSQVGP